ncbi:hypothetical protein BCV70DRAFT_201344 [Testicularia cyperi]|uniref:Uncharacterized protein n=1 Tax=Testicularia cyperi TaxID=1882483 RepID=A0A317XP01_9BASI|nr:hypothetical protein BCV70DRAFT_201344 [Testicularia cyperi]
MKDRGPSPSASAGLPSGFVAQQPTRYTMPTFFLCRCKRLVDNIAGTCYIYTGLLIFASMSLVNMLRTARGDVEMDASERPRWLLINFLNWNKALRVFPAKSASTPVATGAEVARLL